MQKIVLISGGSRGDVQPFLTLGAALQDAGHAVRLLLPPTYADEAAAKGLDFTPLRADFDAMLSSQDGKNLKNSGRNPLAVMREGRRSMKDMTRTLVEDIWLLTEDASAIVGHIGLSPCTQSVASIRAIPVLHVTLQPYMPTRDFSHPLIPMRLPLGKAYNRLSGNMVTRLTWTIFSGEINRFFESYPGVSPIKWKDYRAKLHQTPILNAFSESLIPFPADWQPNNHMTGFWFPPDAEDRQAPDDLVAFLDAGPEPVFIGFGSVSDTASVDLILKALRMSGERAVLVGFDVENHDLPDTVYTTSHVPYEWLFPRMKAAVYHGGAGTTALALRAQLPMVAVPHLLDQFFWAECVYRRGIALKPIDHKKLTAEKLADAITALSTDTTLKDCAVSVGGSIQAEDGLRQAVAIVEQTI